MVSFEFAALDYRSPADNRYAYKLDGLDENWIELGNRHQISFTNLDPGSYNLKVKGSNSDGVWNEAGINLPIFVSAPPWMQWWAYALYGLIAAGIVLRFLYVQREKERTRKALFLAAEESQSANEAKSEFLANMSHEIRTPMNAILGFTNIMLEKSVDEKQQYYLKTISKSGRVLLKIINDILDLSKIEAGKIELEYTSVNPADIFQEMEQVFSQQFSEKNIRFIIDLDPAMPKGLLLEEIRIRQVLLNLIGNAVKYRDSARKGVIRISSRDKGGARVYCVEDNGIGIEKSYQKKVFEIFHRLNPDGGVEGEGLGLTIVMRIVNRLGGEIWLDSESGKGSKFYIKLPST